MQLALALLFSMLTGCVESRLDTVIDPDFRTDKPTDQTNGSLTEERKSLYGQAREGLRQARERYLETTRPVLQRKFRDDYPSLTDNEIEELVNHALEKGFRQEDGRKPDGPIRQPPMDCLSSPGGAIPQYELLLVSGVSDTINQS